MGIEPTSEASEASVMADHSDVDCNGKDRGTSWLEAHPAVARIIRRRTGVSKYRYVTAESPKTATVVAKDNSLALDRPRLLTG